MIQTLYKNFLTYKKFILVRNYVENLMTNYNKLNRNKIQLGRWNLENCDIKTNIKIDRANVDHCGTCSYSNKIN